MKVLVVEEVGLAAEHDYHYMLGIVDSLDKAIELVRQLEEEDTEWNPYDLYYYVEQREVNGQEVQFTEEEVEKYDLESNVPNYKMLIAKVSGDNND